ncbi:MAG: lipopolysaccharide biosynthesis protein [Deltaproteobacteria bacterium]|nr:lipopolysaccharide biosynthesis protein [Deltaproteobacteria bacterium]
MRQRLNTLDDYKAFLIRRRLHTLIPFLIVFAAAMAAAFLLPPVYRSTSTILIESQQIPQDLIKTTVTGYVEKRLQSISQEVMSRAKLLEIIDHFSLYRELKDRKTTEEIIDLMRNDISLEMVNAEAVDPRTGRASHATVAFTLSYEGKNPDKVENVANALATLYLEANLKTRTSIAETSVTFLQEQVELYRNQCAELEKRVAGFKEKHLAELPELLQLNLQSEKEMRKRIDNLDRDIRILQDRKVYLEGQLAMIDSDSPLIDETGRRVLDVRERLKLMKNDLIALLAIFSDKHPDVIRVRKQVEQLEQEVHLEEDLAGMRKELKNKRASLKELIGRFTEKHPDVIRLKCEIAQYKEQLEQAAKTGVVSRPEVAEPQNPAYINLNTQIVSTDMEINAFKEQRKELRQKWMTYVGRLEKMPRVEQEYRNLSRDHDNTMSKYRETMDKLMGARQALSLEEHQVGERFFIIDPATFSEKPVKPNRLAIMLIGIVLGVGVGIGFASVAEFSDTSARNTDELRSIIDLPVLAVIPRIFTKKELAGQRRKTCQNIAIAAGTLIIAVIFFHFFIMDIDIFWLKLMRRF